MTDREKQKAQVAKAEELKDLLLDHWIKQAKDNTLSATSEATITRLLAANGWNLDPNALPQELTAKLTSRVEFDDGLDGDAVPHLKAI